MIGSKSLTCKTILGSVVIDDPLCYTNSKVYMNSDGCLSEPFLQ